MYVRVVSFGTNWWAMHSRNFDDPRCFRMSAAYFNAAALKFGRRLRHSAAFPGLVRFNATSGFNPEFPQRAIGQTFLCSPPNQFAGKTHLLFERKAGSMTPDAYLITLRNVEHGAIQFDRPGWKSAGVRPISISLRGQRYEAMLLFGENDWIKSDIGRWRIDLIHCGVALTEEAIQ